MKTIKTSLLAGALVALAAGTAAAAQPESPARSPAAEVTRDQALARADERFQRMDANRDGRVTAEELRALGHARMAERSERRAERRAERQGQVFDRLDGNRDGQISREEFAQRRELRRGPGGRRGPRGMRGPRGGQMAMRGLGGRLLGEDGVLTAAEFRQRALQRFERLDANRDGRVTAEERHAARDRIRDGRRGPPPPPQQD
jgi:hypothetical protein